MLLDKQRCICLALQEEEVLVEVEGRPCCYECNSTKRTTSQPRFSTSSIFSTPLPTLPPKCPQSCCLAQANINVKSEKTENLEWTSRTNSELVEFLLSPKDHGDVVVEADFSKTIEISGFRVAPAIKSFQIYYKQDFVGSSFVPYRSDITGEIFTFLVNDQPKLYFPNGDTIYARWILIKEIKLASDSVQDVLFDILGCCLSCTLKPSTLIPTVSSTSTLSTLVTEMTTITTMPEISTVTPECKHGDILPKDNCTSYVCKNGKYITVKVCNKVCQDNEQLIQLNEGICCECVPKYTTTALPTTVSTVPTCDNSTEAFLCHRKCGIDAVDKCIDVYKKNPHIFQTSDEYSSVQKCKCPPGFKLEDSLVTNSGIKYFCVQINQCDCTIDGVTHEENSVWHPKDKFNKEMMCKECHCNEGLSQCTNKTCSITCGEGSILIEPSDNEELCCYCASIPTTPLYTGTTTESPFTTTLFSTHFTTASVCDGCKIEIESNHVCKPKQSRWNVGNCETCTCNEESQVICFIRDCQPIKLIECNPKIGEYLKIDSESDKCCNTTSCHICDFKNINVTKCDGICDCPTPDDGKTCPDEDEKNCPKPCQVR